MVPYIATVTHQLPLGIITLHLRLVEVLEVCLALDEGDLLHLGVVAGGVAGGEPLVALHHDRLLAQPSLLLTQTTFMIIRRHFVNLVFSFVKNKKWHLIFHCFVGSTNHEKSKSSLVLHDDVLVEDCSAGGLADHLGHHALVELGQAQVEGDAAVLHLGLAGRV